MNIFALVLTVSWPLFQFAPSNFYYFCKCTADIRNLLILHNFAIVDVHLFS